jgi:hypothetical protein
VPKNVVILATRYDWETARTFEWAKELQGELFNYADNCFFADVTGLCRGGTSFNDLIDTSTHVIFYGHGETDCWTALPGSPCTELLGASTVRILDNKDVYAVCCSSLAGFGAAFSTSCHGTFVGYDDRFGFHRKNELEFKQTVHQSAVNFVVNGNGSQVVNNLRSEWSRLAKEFASGSLQNRHDAIMAGHVASLNAARIGFRT